MAVSQSALFSCTGDLAWPVRAAALLWAGLTLPWRSLPRRSCEEHGDAVMDGETGVTAENDSFFYFDVQ